MKAIVGRVNGGGPDSIPFHGNGNRKVTSPSMCRSGPPLAAIERFLWGQHHFSHKQQQPHNNVARNNNNASVFEEEFYTFGCSGGSTYRFLWPNTQEGSLFGELIANKEPLNGTGQFPALCLKEDVQVSGKNVKVAGRRPKKGSSLSLIKEKILS